MRTRAFTLIELLITASIVSIIGLALFSTLAGGINVYRHFAGRLRTEQDVLIALEKMKRDLSNAFYFSGIDFVGGRDRVSFAGMVNMKPGRISYYYDGLSRALVKKEEDYAAALSETGGAGGIVREQSSSIEDVKFSYFYFNPETKRYEWKNNWFQSKEEEENMPPLGVKAELTFKDKGEKLTLTRTVFLHAVSDE